VANTCRVASAPLTAASSGPIPKAPGSAGGYLQGFLVRLKQFREKAAKAKSSSFLEFLLFKMHSLFLRMGIDHNEQSGFLHLAAELSADIKGLDGEERQREIEKYTTDLRRKGQVRQLRDNAG